MTKELQDLVWQCLPLEAKKEVKQAFQLPTENDYEQGYDSALVSLFGLHNLTSDAEGEDEMLCVSRKKIQEVYRQNKEEINRENVSSSDRDCYEYTNEVLKTLFGSKCLPDDGDELSPEPKPAEPKYHIGQKVKFKDKDFGFEITAVEKRDDCHEYKYKLAGWKHSYRESDLEPYTEPILQPSSQVKEAAAYDSNGIDRFGQHFADTSIAAHGKTDDHIADASKMMRLNIAAIVLQGFVSNPDWSNFKGKNNAELRQKMAKGALDFADALLTEAESSTESLCSAKKGDDK